ncbi:MAG: DUF3185 family protein [Pedobacter sp.]|nr:MAG: DUF3185 family protein [Pedobacter sp.]
MGRTIGIVLIILGIVLLVWTGFTYTKKEKIIDAGPIEISADREKSINWPPYAGIVVLVVGATLFISNRKG